MSTVEIWVEPEIWAKAEKELRDGVLAEFMRPELPAALALLPHCERYVATMFDIAASEILSEQLEPAEYRERIGDLVNTVPTIFFGTHYIPADNSKDERDWFRDFQSLLLDSDCAWARCARYVMLARAQLGPGSSCEEKNMFLEYARRGHLVLSSSLRIRKSV